MKVVFILIISLNFANCQYALSSYNKYEIIFQYVEFSMGKNEKLIDPGTVRPKKYNRTTYSVIGEMELLQPLSDKLKWICSTHVFQGNEYRQYAVREGDKVCSFLSQNRAMIADYFKYVTVPLDFSCPLEPGKYRINDLIIENSRLVFEPPKGDKFRFNLTFFDDDEMISDFAIYVTMTKLPLFTI